MKRLGIYLLALCAAQTVLYAVAATAPAWRFALLRLDPRVGLSALVSLAAGDVFRMPVVLLTTLLIAWLALSLIGAPDRRLLPMYALTELTLALPSLLMIGMAYLGAFSRSPQFWRNEVLAPAIVFALWSIVPVVWASGLYVRERLSASRHLREVSARTVAV